MIGTDFKMNILNFFLSNLLKVIIVLIKTGISQVPFLYLAVSFIFVYIYHSLEMSKRERFMLDKKDEINEDIIKRVK